MEAWLCLIPFDHPKRLVSGKIDKKAHECAPSYQKELVVIFHLEFAFA